MTNYENILYYITNFNNLYFPGKSAFPETKLQIWTANKLHNFLDIRSRKK